MGYRYDPDLAPVVAQRPRRDLTDLTSTRAAVAAAATTRAAVDAIVRREAAEEVAVLRGALAPVPDGDPLSVALSEANSRVRGLR